MKPNSDSQQDARLDTLLRRLPDMPVASNFTARVLQSVEREAPAASDPLLKLADLWIFRPGWRWLPYSAVVATALLMGVYSYRFHTQAARAALAQNMAAIAKVSPQLTAADLQDFNVICRLGQAPDKDLLALMQ
ncbi:MAG TPA: hypothetical protein VL527_06815 [Dongiaceae bacterium]|nr:hypothetical protein [Dongiaceae bacterium]